jgi:hypothetical protein
LPPRAGKLTLNPESGKIKRHYIRSERINLINKRAIIGDKSMFGIGLNALSLPRTGSVTLKICIRISFRDVGANHEERTLMIINQL